ncbi:hypothetical protein ISG33_12180 [Glaciecola sp. MH2013]|uniref:hypothetical protein n=1 Tax=Glaciecola sp. MH2013 TaxID=2785524 RepID=UPI00189D7149|nr:hypothetical protein [Glaciecola sp. MH2013]MBF7074159.1 hypothetical protein [Glaciecola sp. MH2013]
MMLRTVLTTVMMGSIIALAFPSMAEGQFYLIAKQAQEASLASADSPNKVYLSWGLIEGELPDEIVAFRLYRNNTLIGEFPNGQTLSASEIESLYQGPYQQRRLLERVSALKKEAMSSDNDIPDFPTSQYANAIYERLNSGDSFWASMAARQDFNIAVARNLASYDNPGSGIFSYELKAVNSSNIEVRVGLAELDTSQVSNVLANQNFSQILQAQCDNPDFRDHYTVALNWDGPASASQADSLAHRLFVSGYDLYRGSENLPDANAIPASRDLASEAINADYNAEGDIQFAGLERVNDVLILTQPDGSPTPEWLETRDTLLAAGMKPGDSRAYYLVARDFTGQFGPTMSTTVTVPDMARPPAPWGVEAWLSESEQQVELNFPAITSGSYLNAFSAGKRLCVSSDLDDSGRFVEFVPEGEDCATHPSFRVNTEVQSYLVYRFDNSDLANAFSDSDGDGFADALERQQGLQCVKAANDGGTLVARIEQSVNPNEEDIQFIDTTPAQNAGQVYWYRIAALSKGGNLSLLSEPVRVNFPNRSLPAKPIVRQSHPTSQICGCEASYSDPNRGFSMSATAPLTASALNVGCADNLRRWKLTDFEDEKNNACAAYSTVCGSQNPTVSLNIPDPSNLSQSLSCEVNPPDDGNAFCSSGKTQINPTFCDQATESNGGFVNSPLTTEVSSPEPDTCVSVFQRINGQYTRIDSNCGDDRQAVTVITEKGDFCGYAVTQDSNNNVSAITSIPCSQVSDPEQGKPLPVRPESLLLGSEEATVKWRAPRQPQIINEVELTRIQPAGATPIRVSLTPSFDNNNGQEQVSIQIPERSATFEQWCSRIRTLSASFDSASPMVSEWSTPMCTTRSDNAPPQWLPWPESEPVPQDSDLSVINNKVAASYGSSPLSQGLHIPLFTTELSTECEYTANLVGNNLQAPVDQATWLYIACQQRDAAPIRSELSSNINFMVYRQARRPDGEVSRLVPVSPLINQAHWSRFERNDKSGTIPWVYLNDPYIWAYSNFAVVDGFPTETTFAFVDRNGLVNGWDYRYQIVYFGQQQSLSSYRTSDWVTYQNDEENKASAALLNVILQGEKE